MSVQAIGRLQWIVRWRIGERTFISPTDDDPKRVQELIDLVLQMPAAEDLLVLTRQPGSTEWREGLWRGSSAPLASRDFGRRLTDAITAVTAGGAA